MGEPDPFADDPHDVIGIEPGATTEEIRVAAAKAKRKYDPASHPDDDPERIREAFYNIKSAEEELLDDTSTADGPRALELELPPDPRTGEMEVRVRREDGRPAEGIVVVVDSIDARTADERTVTTDGDGVAVVPVPTAGEYEVTATAEMVVETATVAVEPRLVEPTVEFDDDWVVGEESAVTVTVEGEPVSGAVVGLGDEYAETDTSGVARLSPSTAGEQAMTVDVDNTDRRTVREWMDNVEVAPAVVPLSVSADSPVAVSTPATVRVRADGDPVDGARIESLDNRLAAESRADAELPETTDGEATVEFVEAGEATVRADRETDADREYRGDETTVEVWPAEPTATVTATPTEPAVGQQTTLTVTRDLDGVPVDGGTVTLERDGERIERVRTDGSGEVTFTPKVSEPHGVKLTFEAPTGTRVEATTTVAVADREVPELRLRDGDTVAPGETLSCRVVGSMSDNSIPNIDVKVSRDHDGPSSPGDTQVKSTNGSGWVEFDLDSHDSEGADRWQAWAALRGDGLIDHAADPLNSEVETISVLPGEEVDGGIVDSDLVERWLAEATLRGAVAAAVVGVAAVIAALYLDGFGVATATVGGVLAVVGSGVYLWLL